MTTSRTSRRRESSLTTVLRGPISTSLGRMITIGASLISVIRFATRIQSWSSIRPDSHVGQPHTSLSADDALGDGLELVEGTGVDSDEISLAPSIPAYIEYGPVAARPAKDEPAHFHLDIGFAFTTTNADIGVLQETEVPGASWRSLADAEDWLDAASLAPSAPLHESPERCRPRGVPRKPRARLVPWSRPVQPGPVPRSVGALATRLRQLIDAEGGDVRAARCRKRWPPSRDGGHRFSRSVYFRP